MSTPPKIRAFAMFSGGLDSILTARHLLELGVDVVPLHFQLPFEGDPATDDAVVHPGAAPARWARRLGLELISRSLGPGFLEVVRAPKHGRGKGINPCVDCKVYMLTRARELMAEHDIAVVATGEVLGQRPMSQRRDTLRIIERDSGLDGYLLRPLTAQHLKPTVPEERGWVDREKLLDFSGRSRKPQLALAARYGIADPPGSAGGCLLTDQSFARRLGLRFERGEAVDRPTLHLLKYGRHFRAADGTFVIASRKASENEALDRLARLANVPLLAPDGWRGGIAVLEGAPSTEALNLAGRAIARYGKPPEAPIPLRLEVPAGSPPTRITVDGPAANDELDEARI